MSKLSISKAWDESKERLASDGRLLTTVALAMVALPSAISALVNPNSGVAGNDASLGIIFVVFVMSLIALVGQLAIIRLAIGPSVSVGDAIGHAARRALPYIGSVILLVLVFVLLAVPIVLVLAVMGVSFEQREVPLPAGAWIAVLLFIAILLFAAVRMLMTSSVASAESAGPVKILKRSWELTSGHTGRLFAFLLMFLVGLIVVLSAVGIMSGLLVRSLMGDIEPLSAAALVMGLIQGLMSAAATTIFAVMLARIYVQLSGSAAGAAGGADVTVPNSGT